MLHALDFLLPALSAPLVGPPCLPFIKPQNVLFALWSSHSQSQRDHKVCGPDFAYKLEVNNTLLPALDSLLTDLSTPCLLWPESADLGYIWDHVGVCVGCKSHCCWSTTCFCLLLPPRVQP